MLPALFAAAAPCYAPATPVLVQLPPGAPPPPYLVPWHPEPFGHPELARQLGLDRWYRSPDGRIPESAERVEALAPGGIAVWPDDPQFPNQWNLWQDTDVDIDGLAAFRLVGEYEAAGLQPQPGTIAIVDSEMTTPPWSAQDLPLVGYWALNGGSAPVVPPSCTHSIHVASIAAALGNNTFGMTGIAWHAEIQAVQVLTGCFGSQDGAASGVVHAADLGVQTINMSLQYGDVPMTVLASACEYAAQADVVIVAAAGNYSWTVSLAVPAMLPTVIGVGAIDRYGDRPSWSNAGDDLELCAPGQDVLGLTPLGYQVMSGTSMASPHVAGAASVLRSLWPALSAERIREILNSTADDMGVAGRDPWFGFGRLNLYRAILAADPCYADFNMNGQLTAGDFAAFQAAFAAGEHRANCTGDLSADDSPVLSVADFACFQARFVAGCSS